MNNKKSQQAVSHAVVACYRLLKECIVFENIEDGEFICKNLNMIKEFRGMLSSEMYSHIEQFINDVIKPIVYDADYFAFLKRAEFGSLNEEGHFVINSDRSLEMMIFLLYEHTLELEKQLDEFASKYLNMGN